VPPEQDQKVNNATLAGVDVNGNGVRGDAERVMAKNFSKASDFLVAIRFAAAEQKIITGPVLKNRAAALKAFGAMNCLLPENNEALSKFDFDTIIANTKERQVSLKKFYDIVSGVDTEEVPACTQ